MKKEHEELGVHKSAGATLVQLTKWFWWPAMSQDVRRFCRSCDICQLQGKGKALGLGGTSQWTQPFRKIHMDCLVGLPTTKRGHKHALTLLCPFSRYVWAMPLKAVR